MRVLPPCNKNSALLDLAAVDRFRTRALPTRHEFQRRIFMSCIDRCRVAAVAALELDFRGRKRVAMA